MKKVTYFFSGQGYFRLAKSGNSLISVNFNATIEIQTETETTIPNLVTLIENGEYNFPLKELPSSLTVSGGSGIGTLDVMLIQNIALIEELTLKHEAMPMTVPGKMKIIFPSNYY